MIMSNEEINEQLVEMIMEHEDNSIDNIIAKNTAVQKLTKDLKLASGKLTKDEARYLVDMYYQVQQFRITTGNQLNSIANGVDDGGIATLKFFNENFGILEKEIKKALKSYVENQPIGRWLMSIVGIGEVISAGLIANLDINKAKTAGAFQRFAGLDPTLVWEKGQKRPFNAKVKVLCYKLGESFVKTSYKEDSYYGDIYKKRKAYEIEKNENGDYADEAKEILSKKKIGKTTDAYKNYIVGKLPPAHIQARAKRYAVKIFLSHLFDVWYELEFGTKPPMPYAIAQLGHAHLLEAPNKEVIGL